MDPACFGYTIGAKGDDLTFDERDSAPFVPKCVVVDPNFDWHGEPNRRPVPWSHTVIYETHVRGYTKRHPGLRVFTSVGFFTPGRTMRCRVDGRFDGAYGGIRTALPVSADSVQCLHDPDVLHAFFARGLGLAVVPDAIGEIQQLRRELITFRDVLARRRDVDRVHGLQARVVLVVGKRRLDAVPAGERLQLGRIVADERRQPPALRTAAPLVVQGL